MVKALTEKVVSKIGGFFKPPLSQSEIMKLKGAKSRRRREFSGKPDVSATQPSIFLATIPKSATSYISYVLSKSLKYERCTDICLSTYRRNFLSPEKMCEFPRGRMVAVSHMCPSDNNLEIYKHFGGEKIVVHVRDPRAALVSWFHFVEKTMQMVTKVGDRERQARLRRVASPVTEDIFSLPKDARIDALMETFYLPVADRIASWLDVADKEKDIELLFLTYDELLKDEEEYFKRLTHFCGINKKIKSEPKEGNPHFRQGTADGWRKELSESQIQKVNERMPAILWERFGWKRD